MEHERDVLSSHCTEPRIHALICLAAWVYCVGQVILLSHVRSSLVLHSLKA
jgi:hypothetical protein